MPAEQKPKHLRGRSWPTAALYGGGIAVVIACLIIYLSKFINGYLENAVEHEFAKQYPTSSLKLSGLTVNIWKNRIGWDSLELHSADSGLACTLGASWVNGVGWLHLLGKGTHKETALSNAVADLQDLAVKFPRSDYGVACKRLYVSMPDGEIAVSAAELKPVADAEQYFAGNQYRTTRFSCDIPACRITGLAVAELLAGRGYQARSIRLQAPSFDALVDMYAPIDPGIPPGRMPNELLNSISRNIRIDNLQIEDGKLKYGEIYARGATPASVTFDNLQLQAGGIANHGKPEDKAVLRAQAIFMQGGVMKLDIALPLSSPEFSLQYSGSLSPMEISKLNPFLEYGEYLRIDAGAIVRTITYEVRVIAGHASGRLQAHYQDLKISILNKATGSSHDLINEIASYVTNQLKIRRQNIPDPEGALNIGRVEYQRQPLDTFIQFLWFSLRSGVLDVLFQKAPGKEGKKAPGTA
jgi:hypothetical protein